MATPHPTATVTAGGVMTNYDMVQLVARYGQALEQCNADKAIYKAALVDTVGAQVE